MAGVVETQARPRSRSMLSFGSNKSATSPQKVTKQDLEEAAAKDKLHKRMTSKANPNVAVAELEPVAQALEKPTVQSNLRSMSFKDQFGNPITDPDRSNPTRPRLERPLDTIRSFEAAIDGSFSRRMSRTEPMSPTASRPSSYYPGMANGFGQTSYGNRMAPSRPESYVGDNFGYGRQSPMPFKSNPNSNTPRRGFGPRNNSDPLMYGNNSRNGYPPPRRDPYQYQYQHPYDTSTQDSGSGGSGATEPWSNSTDPSSEASSIERFQQQQQQAHQAPPKPDLGEQYGFTGFGGAPQGLDSGPDSSYYGGGPNGLDRHPLPGLPPQQQQYHQQQLQRQNEDIPPPPPPHFSNHGVRSPSKPNTLQRRSTQTQGQQQRPGTSGGEKRKSWLMRRFSKNN